MNFLNDPIVIENIANIIGAGFFAFLVSFLLTPWIGRLASAIGAVDLPASLRSSSDRTRSTRIHKGIKPRLGGLSVAVAVVLGFLLSQDALELGEGVFVGIVIISVVGFLDDKFEMSGALQLLGQLAAAFAIVWSGITISDEIMIAGLRIDINWYSNIFVVGNAIYEFVFPSHILTIVWIIGVTNVVNWIGGVDGLNISVTSIISFTLLLFALSTGSIPLAVLISIHIGANLGLLPFNYAPSKIIPGGIDTLNGFMVAIFALLGETGWTITLIVLAVPLLDSIIVMYIRLKQHPKARKNPLLLLRISDKNHLQHRFLAMGYSHKAIMLIVSTITLVVCSIAVVFGINVENDTSNQIIVGFFIAMTFMVSMFTVVFYLKNRAERLKSQRVIRELKTEKKKEAVVKVVFEEDEDYEKFVY